MTVSVEAFMLGVAVARAARFLWGVRCHRKAQGAGRWQADQQHSPNAQAQVTCPINGTFILRWMDALSRATRHRLRWRGPDDNPNTKYGPHFPRETKHHD